jgi:hypothetical protein
MGRVRPIRHRTDSSNRRIGGQERRNLEVVSLQRFSLRSRAIPIAPAVCHPERSRGISNCSASTAGVQPTSRQCEPPAGCCKSLSRQWDSIPRRWHIVASQCQQPAVLCELPACRCEINPRVCEVSVCQCKPFSRSCQLLPPVQTTARRGERFPRVTTTRI